MEINPEKMPRHVAIIMDGNGRWAKKRFMPRFMGHRAGAKLIRTVIDFCVKHKIDVLSLFALSAENFQVRPEAEVRFLLSLFSDLLIKNLDEMYNNGIHIRIVGDVSAFDENIQTQIQHAQEITKNNTALTFVIAVNYSGRWDIFQAAKRFAKIATEQSDEKEFTSFLCLSDLPEPELLIRTGGEKRISNFMLWQFAYTELFFTDVCWPDFDEKLFADAIDFFQTRVRRFGKVV